MAKNITVLTDKYIYVGAHTIAYKAGWQGLVPENHYELLGEACQIEEAKDENSKASKNANTAQKSTSRVTSSS